MQVRRIWKSFALVCASLSFSISAFAGSNDLTVSLAVSDRAHANDQEVLVDVVFTNHGAAPVSLVRWFMPDGELDADLFLLSRDGQAVAYLGPVVKRTAPTSADLVTLQPGESIVRSVDLAGLYDLSASGVYSIQYNAASAQLFGTQERYRSFTDFRDRDTEIGGGAQELFSNEVSTWVDGKKSPLIEQFAAMRAQNAFATKAISFSGKCSATQQTTITSAHNAAKTMANGATSYLAGTPGAKPRYTTWFGTYSSAGWSEVKTHFTAIKDALDNKPVVYDCSCKKSYYAYVYPTQPYKIYLCRAFWTAPLTGTDSKGGTIIHEASHFNAVAGTDDIAYGQSAAKSLALSNPAQARINADSHEYFAENTPALN